jgi:hypothetical protein
MPRPRTTRRPFPMAIGTAGSFDQPMPITAAHIRSCGTACIITTGEALPTRPQAAPVRRGSRSSEAQSSRLLPSVRKEVVPIERQPSIGRTSHRLRPPSRLPAFRVDARPLAARQRRRATHMPGTDATDSAVAASHAHLAQPVNRPDSRHAERSITKMRSTRRRRIRASAPRPNEGWPQGVSPS